ncbi:hypothetical protein GCM10010387_54400 [Streptomyces inusitatus]|uniref:Uncharacterized protein n=1 Tax=Streptomyces inusitatus TaxID=68221 RepID=A0A918V0W3_9ACTN|nr:hypothetical protein GCM10010387_54400 [Streptomyces inusitatus]
MADLMEDDVILVRRAGLPLIENIIRVARGDPHAEGPRYGQGIGNEMNGVPTVFTQKPAQLIHLNRVFYTEASEKTLAALS